MASLLFNKIPLLFSFLTSFSSLNWDSTSHPYLSIFSFGDSLADTGNLVISNALLDPVAGRPPYGETYFRNPTGRYSDGRLIIDFMAEAFGLPLLPPYLSSTNVDDFRQGVNFAVSGATALDPSFFEERNLSKALSTNFSLSVQLDWFKELKSSICITTKDCAEYLRKSLFVVGEIGGNDYNYAFWNSRGMDEVRSFVPHVVKAIEFAISTLIEQGAVKLVVPGNLPIGCISSYLTLLHSPDEGDYDPQNDCLKAHNDFSEYHNAQLNRALERLRHKYPHAKIVYADYYGAAMQLYNAPQNFGFNTRDLSACCGGGGPYNYNLSAKCGYYRSSVCDDPSKFVIWDGIHLTEAAYRHIATGLLEGPFTTPSISTFESTSYLRKFML
eukprot:TRINITY_DN24131_c0_g1_i1.p1 TRINITY_DN24131_c0_g1~~TRINITY_DN24131_c0_g1_i1.p1  ORF type:complete len:385 (+),score=21.89 TRINITY_DN24131_c0_g1_i1:55-1209(+)